MIRARALFAFLCSLRVRRLGKLTCACRAWRYVPTAYESVTHAYTDSVTGKPVLLHPRAGFGCQVARLAFVVTYAKC